MAITKEKTYIEYEDAPSGEVYFYNYKEPLMKFEEGFGYVGALIHESSSNQIQCHLCGGWFDTLQHHLKKEHNMTAPQYKAKVGLNKGTALISETFRARLIKQGLEIRLKNLRTNKKHSKKTREKISATLRENRDEMKNIHNTCPEQLLERLVGDYNKIGDTPQPKYLTYEETLVRVFGSYKEACRLAGIPYYSPKEAYKRYCEKRTKELKKITIERVARFYQANGRLPKGKETKPYNHLLHDYGRKEIFKQALSHEGVYKRVDFIVRYDKETLIKFLRMFEKNNGRKPSHSDCRRGLLPSLGRYSYRFGSWKNALKEAFPEPSLSPLEKPFVSKSPVSIT